MIGNVFKRFLTNKPANIPAHLVEFFEKRSTTQCFDSVYLSKMKIINAVERNDSVLIELKVDETLINVNKSIHGGVLASLVDSVTTAALHNYINKSGVSVEMNLSFIKPANLNETILIKGSVDKAGNKLAFLSAHIYLKSSEKPYDLDKKQLVATGTHTKYII